MGIYRGIFSSAEKNFSKNLVAPSLFFLLVRRAFSNKQKIHKEDFLYMKQQKDFSTIVVRVYDKELLDKIHVEYTFSGGRYESKNHLITELIEAGLERKRDDRLLWDKLQESDGALVKSVAALTERVTELEKFARSWLQYIGGELDVNQRILGAVYALVEAANNQQHIPELDLESGHYDYPPDRFTKTTEEILEEYK